MIASNAVEKRKKTKLKGNNHVSVIRVLLQIRLQFFLNLKLILKLIFYF